MVCAAVVWAARIAAGFGALSGSAVLAASRTRIEEYLKATKGSIWIEHEWAANAGLKKLPQYYE